MNAPSRFVAIGLLVALGWVFGAAFLFMKVLVEEISPGEVVAGRLVFGALVLWAFLLPRGVRLDWRPVWLLQVGLLASLEMVAPYLLISWAEIEIDSGVAAVLISAMPLFTAILVAVSLPEESLTRRQMAGLAVGFAGVVVVSGVGVSSFGDGSLAATLAVIAAAASYAGGIVYARVLLRRGDPLSLTGQQMLLGAIVTFAGLSIIGGLPSYALSREGWSALVALGFLSTGVGMLGSFWLVSKVGSVQTSLVTYVVPVAGLTLGWAVLGEDIGPNVLAGMLLIAAGVSLVLRGAEQEAPAPRVETPAATALAAGD